MQNDRLYVDSAYDLEQRAFVPGGFVELVDRMGEDLKPAEVARISYSNADKKNVTQDINLVEYLWSNKHTSPFEFVEVEFRIRMPIFVARQLFRHRTASVNEFSMRYSKALPLVWVADQYRVPDKLNKQGSVGKNEADDILKAAHIAAAEYAYRAYLDALKQGAPKEQARTILPVAMYTEVRWKQDFKNLSHLLMLRMDHHAQLETRYYAIAMYSLLRRYYPNLTKLFKKYTLESITLTHDELEILLAAVRANNPDHITNSVKSKSRASALCDMYFGRGGLRNSIEADAIERDILEFNKRLLREEVE